MERNRNVRGRGRGRTVNGNFIQDANRWTRRHAPPPTAAFAEPKKIYTTDAQKKSQEPKTPLNRRNISPDPSSLQPDPEIETNVAFPAKPGPGVHGKPIELIANHFEIIIPEENVYHYDVEISQNVSKSHGGARVRRPKRVNLEMSRNVVNEMMKSNSTFRGNWQAFDGKKNLITKHILPRGELKIPVRMEDEYGVEDYIVKIKPVVKQDGDCSISLKAMKEYYSRNTTDVPSDAIMALEIIMRQTPTIFNVSVGRSFFNSRFGAMDMGAGKEIWFGYYQNVQLSQWKPMINVDKTATTFYKRGPIIAFACELLKLSEEKLGTIYLENWEVSKLSKELKGLKIVVNHLKYPRKYKVLKVTFQSSNELKFTFQGNGKTTEETVSKYFSKQYRKLKYPNLPCLHVGSPQKKVYLPMEVCELMENQHYKKELGGTETAIMIRKTARPPEERFRDIETMVRSISSDPVLNGFGLRISTTPLHLGGRIIDPPSVKYKSIDNENEEAFTPRQGFWDMKGKTFYEAARIEKWVLLSFVSQKYCNRHVLEIFAEMLYEVGTNCGMAIKKREDIKFYNPNVDLEETFKYIKRTYQPNLVVIVIEKSSIYAEIKRIANTKFGLVTQCVLDINVKKSNVSLVENICQKINAKMGGTNNCLEDFTNELVTKVFSKPIIIIGADVTHPAPGEATRTSIVAVVGSVDSYASKYHAVVRTQENEDNRKKSQEIILELKGMVVELLKAFYRYTEGKKPEKIIFFRDGVSNGQFKHVRDKELVQIRNACSALEKDYKPPITFIVVQKRHHTRFRPSDLSEGVGPMKNIPPGTVVDKKVVHPFYYDFFLCSHYGLQGTSRPAHYTLLWDDNDFSADDIQMLSYYLCHNYARCTRTISIPTPVMYADLLAYKMKLHLKSSDYSNRSFRNDGSKCSNVPNEFLEVLNSIPNIYKMFFI